MNKSRCQWAGSDPLYIAYHDKEWGMPVYDDQKLFEFLILEGMQAGLSWITILRKRENYRMAFDNFDAVKISRYKSARIEKLMKNEGIIRNRLKIEAVIANARAYLQVQKEFGSFAQYIWGFVDNRPVINNFKTMKEVPPITETAVIMSKNLKKRGFKFVGPTICYAFMQAVGLVNDHTIDCFRHEEVQKLAQKQIFDTSYISRRKMAEDI
jgi:DNA-3-methyladenine glycosylase I